MYYSHEFSHFRSHFHFQFTFRTRTAHQEKIKPIDECIRMSNLSDLSDLMYAHIIKYCLVYFCVAFSRVLRIMIQTERSYIRQLYVVELAVGSEQKLYFFMNCHLGPVLGLSYRRTSLTIKFSRVHRTLYVSLI